MDSKTTEALAAFVATCQSVIDTHFAKNFPTLTAPRLTVELGRRYAKLIKNEGMSRSVHCFVDLTNGDVLKSETWKKPAKHARGSIFSAQHGEEAVSAYGAHYLSR
jgi:hypothetical protein